MARSARIYRSRSSCSWIFCAVSPGRIIERDEPDGIRRRNPDTEFCRPGDLLKPEDLPVRHVRHRAEGPEKCDTRGIDRHPVIAGQHDPGPDRVFPCPGRRLQTLRLRQAQPDLSGRNRLISAIIRRWWGEVCSSFMKSKFTPGHLSRNAAHAVLEREGEVPPVPVRL